MATISKIDIFCGRTAMKELDKDTLRETGTNCYRVEIRMTFDNRDEEYIDALYKVTADDTTIWSPSHTDGVDIYTTDLPSDVVTNEPLYGYYVSIEPLDRDEESHPNFPTLKELLQWMGTQEMNHQHKYTPALRSQWSDFCDRVQRMWLDEKITVEDDDIVIDRHNTEIAFGSFVDGAFVIRKCATAEEVEEDDEEEDDEEEDDA